MRAIFAMGIWVAGCAPSLLDRKTGGSGADTGADSGDTADTAPAGPTVVSTDLGGGVTQLWVDATAYQTWVYVSFASPDAVTPADPTDSTAWDLGFERYLVMLNGGVSGTAGEGALVLSGQDFDSLTTAPAGDYAVDLPDDDDDNQNPQYAMGEWFAYAEEDHTLTPLDQVYVISGQGGAYYKFQFLSYYDDAGTPAYLTAKWAVVDAPI